MKIQTNKVVSLSYTLTVDGDVIETVTAEKPMQFIYGTGYLLPKFEENIKEKSVGDLFDFVLAAADAYGEINEKSINSCLGGFSGIGGFEVLPLYGQ